MFEGVQGVRIESVTDGTSNTVLLALARDAVPWTQPGELPFVQGQPLPALDASNPRGYVLGITDGVSASCPGARKKSYVRRSRDAVERSSCGHQAKVPHQPNHAARRACPLPHRRPI